MWSRCVWSGSFYRVPFAHFRHVWSRTLRPVDKNKFIVQTCNNNKFESHVTMSSCKMQGPCVRNFYLCVCVLVCIYISKMSIISKSPNTFETTRAPDQVFSKVIPTAAASPCPITCANNLAVRVYSSLTIRSTSPFDNEGVMRCLGMPSLWRSSFRQCPSFRSRASLIGGPLAPRSGCLCCWQCWSCGWCLVGRKTLRHHQHTFSLSESAPSSMPLSVACVIRTASFAACLASGRAVMR